MDLAKRIEERWGREVKQKGFALPTVLIVSIILLAIGVSTLQIGAAISRSLTDQHWNREAKVAAQSGVAFASSCINKGITTWSVSITPNMTCNATAVSPPRDIYIAADTSASASPSKWRSTYTIDPPVIGSDTIPRARIVGQVEVLSSINTNIVVKTYTWDYTVILSGSKTSAKVSVGEKVVCSLTTDAQVYCVGYNAYGQLGDTTTTNRSSPVKFQLPAGLSTPDADADDYHTCVVTHNQLIYCAGDNTYGQFGDNGTGNRPRPVKFQLPAGRVASAVSADDYHSCALTTDQLVYCSGDNSKGQLGDGGASGPQSNLPVNFQLPAGKVATIVSSADGNHTCTLTNDLELWCAGDNSLGQFGNGSTVDQFLPVKFQLQAGLTASATSADDNNICVLASDQAVYCSGSNANGQLGDDSGSNKSTPVKFQLPAGKVAIAVSVDDNHICALTTDQLIYCAGFNFRGALGDGTGVDQPLPVKFQLPAGVTAVELIADGGYTCALTNDQSVYCAGLNTDGQLGNDTGADQLLPVKFQLPAGKTATAVSQGLFNICVLTNDQLIYCAGDNSYGQLSDGVTTTDRRIPVLFRL